MMDQEVWPLDISGTACVAVLLTANDAIREDPLPCLTPTAGGGSYCRPGDADAMRDAGCVGDSHG